MFKKKVKSFLNRYGFEVRKIDSNGNKNILKSKINEYKRNLKSIYPDFNIKSTKGNLDNVSFSGFDFIIETDEEYYILNEVFYEKCYNLSLSSEAVLFDIGLNIGITSVYYSSIAEIIKIYSFEPVVETFNHALANIKLNEYAKNKITAYNYGLGLQDGKASFEFNPDFKGSVGIIKSNNIDKSLTPKQKIEVEIKDASKILKPIIEKHKSQVKILKIDCEGGEFDIIQNLFDRNLIPEFQIILIEWHQRNPEILITSLKSFDFVVHRKDISNSLGMIYAFKIDG